MVFLFAFILILVIIYFSKIQVQIINLKFSSIMPRHLNKDYKIAIRWYILSKIPIMKFNINKTKMEKIKIKEKIRNIDFKILEEQGKIDVKKLKTLKAALTSILVPVISTVIAIVLRKKVRKYENQIFIINSVYLNQNLLNISLSGIFEIKINHIINMIYILNKKEGVNKYERTSNRRSYDYSYE